MSRTSVLAGFLVFGVISVSWAGNERSTAIATKRAALEDQLRIFLEDHGPTHPAVVALKERIALLTADAAQGAEINPKGLLVVFSKANVQATLKDARVLSLGGRSFVVGVAVEGPKITKAQFTGRVVWIPVDDVIQMVEVADDKGK
jgi:hypothetical protein